MKVRHNVLKGTRSLPTHSWTARAAMTKPLSLWSPCPAVGHKMAFIIIVQIWGELWSQNNRQGIASTGKISQLTTPTQWCLLAFFTEYTYFGECITFLSLNHKTPWPYVADFQQTHMNRFSSTFMICHAVVDFPSWVRVPSQLSK